MPTYKYEITQQVYASLKEKAATLKTTIDEMLDSRLKEFCEACHCEIKNKRRNGIISMIVDVDETKLEAIAKLLMTPTQTEEKRSENEKFDKK